VAVEENAAVEGVDDALAGLMRLNESQLRALDVSVMPMVERIALRLALDALDPDNKTAARYVAERLAGKPVQKVMQANVRVEQPGFMNLEKAARSVVKGKAAKQIGGNRNGKH
jgi:hypothetical protein